MGNFLSGDIKNDLLACPGLQEPANSCWPGKMVEAGAREGPGAETKAGTGVGARAGTGAEVGEGAGVGIDAGTGAGAGRWEGAGAGAIA